MPRGSLSARAFLMHISHYDPAWCETKEAEEPFDLGVGLELVDAMAKASV